MAMDDDKELGPIPAHIREALESTDNLAHPRWVFVKNKGPVHPRSEIACMLRASDRRHSTTDSLMAINYGQLAALVALTMLIVITDEQKALVHQRQPPGSGRSRVSDGNDRRAADHGRRRRGP